MKLCILNIAYPFAPVRDDTAGGAEQVLLALDRALMNKGHNSIVLAQKGSAPSGKLLEIEIPGGIITDEKKHNAYRIYSAEIRKALKDFHIDLIHMHGLDFHSYLPTEGPPVLVTLHLPLAWYAEGVLAPKRPNTFLHCVSHSQMKIFPGNAKLNFLPVIANGVPVQEFELHIRKRNYAVSLGRICPEKGFHIALNAARRTELPLFLAGEVFPYETHQRYFESEILPRLDSKRKFIGKIDFIRKRRLLSGAKCLLAPSSAPETSSLTAMESLACGTPVIAFPEGALADIVEDGRTGLLVRNEEEMVQAINEIPGIDPGECRKTARMRFSSECMIRSYFEIYEKIASGTNPYR